MVFGYVVRPLSEEEILLRREQLDAHAQYAQVSAIFVLFLVFVSNRISRFIEEYILVDDDSRTIGVAKLGQSNLRWLRQLRAQHAKLRWWLGEDLVNGWGTRGQWIAGLSWTGWMMFLCIHDTGTDYFHITKRFGIVPASLLPIHYMLAMKSSFSPIQFLTRLSHEQLKPIHEILGKILCFLFLWHAGFYLNFFYQSGNLSDRLQGTAEMLGLISILSIVTTSSIALGFIRRWSYRIFYFTHITLAMLILATLFFHVGHVRVYILESLAVVVIFSILRLFNIHTYANGQLTIIPQTNLIKVSIPLDKGGDLQRWKPGQHIYLSRPGVAAKESNLSSWIRKGQVNPFTVASIPSRDGKLLLIARTLKGSTKKMAALAKSIKQNAEPGRSTKTDVSVTIEGPYGCSAYLPDLWGYSRVLFVAGGVGATFIVPLKRSLTEGRATSRRPAVRFVWSVRSLAETSWAFQTSKDTLQDIEDEPNQNDSNSPFSTSSTADTHIYVTRTATSAAASRALEQQAAGSESEEEGIELEEADGLLASSASETLTQRERRIRNDPTVEVHDGRPSLSTIVDDMFVSREEKIAVIVCGPTSLERAVRQEVGRWVYKGQHDLFYHAEAFGW